MLSKDKEDKLIEIFVTVDDFCLQLDQWLESNPQQDFKKPRFEGVMSKSEVMTVIIFYQFSGYKCFQYYYQEMVQQEMTTYFPQQVGYKRFLQLISKSVETLYIFSKYRCMSSVATGIYYVDSKKLPSCHSLRRFNHKVFNGLAQSGKTSTGWFYGLKIHLVINNVGQVMNFEFTSGNIHDANPELLRRLLLKLKGNCYGDKGYISKVFEELYRDGLKLITRIRKNMKNKLMPIEEKYQLFKRGIIESVFDIMMSVFDIDHTRHRSPVNGMAHMFAAVGAYSFMEHKPSVLLPKLLN